MFADPNIAVQSENEVNSTRKRDEVRFESPDQNRRDHD